VPSSDIAHRVRLALPPLGARARGRAVEQGWELILLDPKDPDERAILIRLAHPDLDGAIESGLEEIVVHGEPMNPRLHLTIHEIVATQVIDDDPPEVFTTLQRLVESGRDHHEAIHMIGWVVSTQLRTAMHEQRPHERAEHLRALAALPESWDAQTVEAIGRPRPPARRRTRRHRHRR
jgi:uncharacterized protein DUF1841